MSIFSHEEALRGILELGYSTTLPVIRIEERKYHAQLPNGNTLESGKLNSELRCWVQADFEAPINVNNYLLKLGSRSQVHFWLPLYETVNTNQFELGKSIRQKVFMKKINIENFDRNICEGKRKFFRLLNVMGLTPSNSELYLLLSADEK